MFDELFNGCSSMVILLIPVVYSMTGTGREEKGKKGKLEERKEVIGLFWNFFLTPDLNTISL